MTMNQGFLARLPISKPTLVVDEKKTRRNIERMAAKAQAAGIRLRPHAKTHQSAVVAEWFRDYGINAITVSSVDMAAGFARAGWEDITIAFPCNIRQMAEIDELASQIKLGILVDSSATIESLSKGLSNRVNVWIKVDVGYGRAGVPWEKKEKIARLAVEAASAENLEFAGLLTHAGHTYDAGSRDEIVKISQQTTERMKAARKAVLGAGRAKCEISVGDTPGCAISNSFEGLDEIRCGNFVYFDAMQWLAGVCGGDEISAVVACPVVSVYPERGQALIYGGAVHLSKDSAKDAKGNTVYGFLVLPEEHGWGEPQQDAPVVSISQEHGRLSLPKEQLSEIAIGDLVLIAPVHSCLAADLLGGGLTINGVRIDRVAATAK